MKRRNMTAAIFVAGTLAIAGCTSLIGFFAPPQKGIGFTSIPWKSTPEPAVQLYFPSPAPAYEWHKPTPTPSATLTPAPLPTGIPTPTPYADDYIPEIVNQGGQKDRFDFERDYMIGQRVFVYYMITGPAEEFTIRWGDGKTTNPAYGSSNIYIEGYRGVSHFYSTAFPAGKVICMEAAGPKLIRKVCGTVSRDMRFLDSFTYIIDDKDFTVEIIDPSAPTPTPTSSTTP